MKKRIFSLLLCMLLISTMLIGCGKTLIDKVDDYLQNNELQSPEPYVTLNLYIPTTGTPDASVVSNMQLQVNQVIESKYNTRVIFHMVDEQQYKATLNEQASLAKQNEATPLDTSVSAVNDLYPIENNFQFDIFVAMDKTMLTDYVSRGYVADLSTQLTTTYNRLLSNQNDPNCIPALIYDNAYITSETTNIYYGVPANFLIGEYSYYLVNKANADDHYFSTSTTKTVEERIAQLRRDISNDTTITDKESYLAETIIEADGNYELRNDYSAFTDEECYVLIRNNPVLSNSDIFSGMFCVSAMCRYPNRALSVIYEIFSNMEIHTALQYGARNLTYRLITEEDGSIHVELIENAPVYQMNAKYTGNILTLYPTQTGVYTAAYAQMVRNQNKDAVLEN